MGIDYVTRGVYTRTSVTVGGTVVFPTSLIPAGDLLVMHFAHSNNGPAATSLLTVPAPWTLMFQDLQPNIRQMLYGKIATGDDAIGGNVSIGFTVVVTAVNAALTTVMYQFTGNNQLAAVTDQYENPAVSGSGATGAVEDTGVAVNGLRRLVCNFGTRSAAFSPSGGFAGQTGGTWVLKAWGVSGASPSVLSCKLFLQTASDVVSSINGGLMTSDTATGTSVYLVRGLALLPAPRNVPQKLHHYVMMKGV